MQKKRIFLFIVISIIVLLESVNAQDFKVGLTVTPFGTNNIFRFTSLEGDGSYSGDGFYIAGITCQIPITSRLDIETGFEYSNHTILITPAFYPDIDMTSSKSKITLASIPLTLKINFLKYFFVNGGCLLDLETSTSSSIDNQTGLAAILGFGIKYDFKFGGSIFANPYLKCHSLFPFSPERYHQRLFESGIRIGVVYNLSK